jgi:uncharacterized delta-60 repeat protein
MAIVRYGSNGLVDAGFGTSGIAKTLVGTAAGARSLAVLSDGSILAAGYAGNGSNTDFAVVKYTVDGTLDTTFGTGGKITTVFGNENDNGYAVALQPDGKILVAGETRVTSSDPWKFALVRYSATGSLDTTFGTGGKITTAIGSMASGQGVGVQSDGKIVVAGYGGLARYWP